MCVQQKENKTNQKYKLVNDAYINTNMTTGQVST